MKQELNEYGVPVVRIRDIAKGKDVEYDCKDCGKHIKEYLVEGYEFLENNKLCGPCHYGYHQGER